MDFKINIMETKENKKLPSISLPELLALLEAGELDNQYYFMN